ncbi:MAG: hypothetical protein V2A77_04305 [Pseudomonadota bacterium]
MKPSPALRLSALAAVLVSVFMAGGCATCVNKVTGTGISRQEVLIDSDPPGAMVRILKDGLPYRTVATPTKIWLHRETKNYTLVFEKEGYAPQTVVIEGRLNEWKYYLGNLVTLGMGALFDDANGAAWSLSPTKVRISLNQAPGGTWTPPNNP